MKILITGYKGFIGYNMWTHFKASKIDDVFSYTWGEKFPWKTGERYDWVIHLGAISSTNETNVDRLMLKNYEFTTKLIDWCNDTGTNIQYASSASVYGFGPNFSENSPCDPRNGYAWSKYLVDRYVTQRAWKVKVQGFRYFNVYGPNEDHKSQPSPFTKFRMQAKNEGKITVFEKSNKALRDFVPVSRLIEVHKEFLKIQESGIWNIGSGRARSFLSVAEEIAEEMKVPIEEVPMPEDLRKSYQWYTEADLTKLNHTLDMWR